MKAARGRPPAAAAAGCAGAPQRARRRPRRTRSRRCRAAAPVAAGGRATSRGRWRVERGADERRARACTCRRVQLGQRVAEQAMRAVAGEDGGERADQERRVRRPAIEADAGQQLVEQAEHRRVPAERVEQRDAGGDGEEADLARPQPAAQRRQDQQEREWRRCRAGPCSGRGRCRCPARRSSAGPSSPPCGPRRRTRPAQRSVSSRAGCSEPRPAPMKSIDGPVGLRGQQRGQQHGHGDQRERRRLRPPTAAGGWRAPRPPAGRPRAGARARSATRR